jgi:hypothetical protein
MIVTDSHRSLDLSEDVADEALDLFAPRLQRLELFVECHDGGGQVGKYRLPAGLRRSVSGSVGGLEHAGNAGQGYSGLRQPADPSQPGDVDQVVVAAAVGNMGDGQQTDLVVGADRPHGGTGEVRQLLDAHLPGGL